MIVAWLVFPAVLAVLATGCGLALERAARVVLPGLLLVPAGLAVIIVVGGLTTATDATAEITVPLVIVLAAAGLALPSRIPSIRSELPVLAAAFGVFAAFAAPVVLSGQATFSGYLKLDDTATFLALVDRVMDHGRSLGGLAPSTYETTLAVNLGAYPVGSLLPLGIGANLLDHDPAWLWQPWLACLAAALALSLDALLRPLIPRAPLRALCTFAAAQPALLFGYALWGGVKEIATAWIVALAAATVPVAIRAPGLRSVLPLAVAVAAALAVASIAGGIWVALPVAATVVVVMRVHGRRRAMILAGALALFTAALAGPSLVVGRDFLSGFIGGGKLLTSETDIGNLFGRISELQILGVWPSGDFRVDPDDLDLARMMMAVVAISAVWGVVCAARRRAWELLLYAGGTTAAGLAIAVGAGPWVAAKSLAIASPAVLVAATAGAAFAWLRGWRVEAAVVGAVVVIGVLWSNALAYREMTLAPRAQLGELERIGRMTAGEGPSLMTEYNPYGARHFLRHADAEGVSELRRRPIPLRTGAQAQKGAHADTDEIALDALLEYRTLVLRRTPVASRPPAPYELTFQGDTYEVWQRRAAFTAPLEHLPLGGALSSVDEPRCEDVRRLATVAGSSGLLATTRSRPPVIVELGRLPVVAGWAAYPGSPASVHPNAGGTLTFDAAVPDAGTYRVWLGGSVHGQVDASIDDRRVGHARGVVNTGGYLSLGNVRLAAGSHRIAITHRKGGWRPGARAQDVLPLAIGPFALHRAEVARRVDYVRSADWKTLCGKALDWIEAMPARV